MASATLIQTNPAIPGGLRGELPTSSLALAETIYWATDTDELLRCRADGTAWDVLATGGGGGGGSTAVATGTLTVVAGATGASAAHGMAAPLVAAVTPGGDTLGARWWDGFDTTNVFVTIDHAQAADLHFTWVGIGPGGGGGGGGVGSIPVIDLIPGVNGDVLETVGGFAVWAPGATDFRYVHSQGTASATWDIAHNLGGFPNVSVVDSANTKVEGGVRYVDANNIQLSFSAPFSGQAYLS